MDLHPTLKNFGFSDNEINIYLALLRLGPSPVRKIALASQVNRGTCYDVLKSLMDERMVSYYHKAKHQYFVAEDPKNLALVLQQKQKNIDELQTKLKDLVPALQSLSHKDGKKPLVKYYEGSASGKTILQDVLDSCEKLPQPLYRVYSAEPVTHSLYAKFPDFTEERIERKISVKVISLWQGGGTAPLAERRYLPTPAQNSDTQPNFVLIYAGKAAFFSLDSAGELIAVLLEDPSIFKTQCILFDALWKSLK